MPLSADQKATLQLLLERGQTYADLSSLLEVSEAEVRERARSALEELAGADPDRSVGLTDYLLGQADPIDRADVARQLRDDPDDHRLATTIVERLRELFPAAELPRLPGEPGAGRFLRRPPAAAPAGTEPAASTPPAAAASRLTRRQSQLLVGLGAAAVLLVAAVLAIAGVFEGSGETTVADDDPAEVSPPAESVTLLAPGPVVLRGDVALDETPAGGEDPDQISVPLEPVGDRDGQGQAVFGLTGQDQLYVDLDLRNLEPAGDERTYVLWLMLTAEEGMPLAPLELSAQGRYDERLPVPPSLLPVLSQMQFVTVELSANRVLADLIEGAIAELPGVPQDGGGG